MGQIWISECKFECINMSSYRQDYADRSSMTVLNIAAVYTIMTVISLHLYCIQPMGTTITSVQPYLTNAQVYIAIYTVLHLSSHTYTSPAAQGYDAQVNFCCLYIYVLI